MRSRILASVALAALLSAPAFAQSSSSAPQAKDSSEKAAPSAGAGSSTTTTSGTKSDADSGAAKAPAAAVIETQERSQLTADALIGMEVRNPQDEDVGKIEDLVLDSEMQVVGYVVSVGGFLGMGQHDVALSRDQVKIEKQPDQNEQVAIVSMTKEQLKAAPEFKTLERQQAEAEQERARQSQGTAAGTGARPPGGGATTPPTKTQ